MATWRWPRTRSTDARYRVARTGRDRQGTGQRDRLTSKVLRPPPGPTPTTSHDPASTLLLSRTSPANRHLEPPAMKQRVHSVSLELAPIAGTVWCKPDLANSATVSAAASAGRRAPRTRARCFDTTASGRREGADLIPAGRSQPSDAPVPPCDPAVVEMVVGIRDSCPAVVVRRRRLALQAFGALRATLTLRRSAPASASRSSRKAVDSPSFVRELPLGESEDTGRLRRPTCSQMTVLTRGKAPRGGPCRADREPRARPPTFPDTTSRDVLPAPG